MTKGAVIVDNRPIGDAIERHERYLPADWSIIHLRPQIYSIQDYNNFVVSDFWEGMPDVVLIFQHDSGLLRSGIEDFLEWDYVGAPWAWQEWGGNGGLSLRKRDAMLEVIKNFPYDGSNEDVWFCKGLKELGLKIAPREVCDEFSVEACYKLGTLGYHGIHTWLNTDQVNQILTQYD